MKALTDVNNDGCPVVTSLSPYGYVSNHCQDVDFTGEFLSLSATSDEGQIWRHRFGAGRDNFPPESHFHILNDRLFPSVHPCNYIHPEELVPCKNVETDYQIMRTPDVSENSRPQPEFRLKQKEIWLRPEIDELFFLTSISDKTAIFRLGFSDFVASFLA